MRIQTETTNFFTFVVIGVVFAFIFDFFRALRKIKKTTQKIVMLQDILYFFIIGNILVISIINIRDEVFRLYLILAIFLGATIYFLVIGNKIRDLVMFFASCVRGIVEFIFLPLKIQIEFWSMICKKIKKCVKQCCKKKTYMIEFYHKKVKNSILKVSCKENKRRKRVEK